MALFSRKEKTSKEGPSSFPEFPRLPNEQKFPMYEQEIEPESYPIKKEFNFPQMGENKPSSEDFDIPMRKPTFQKPVTEEPIREQLIEEKPVFIKIEKYREALEKLSKIKEELEKVEERLSRIEEIQTKEDKEIESWRSDINSIKQKLLSVDSKLFEV